MPDALIRLLDRSEVHLARDLSGSVVDVHLRCVIEQQPAFFEIVRVLDPDPDYFNRQLLIVGAFIDDELIGTTSLQRVTDVAAPELLDDHPPWEQFTERDLNLFCHLSDSLQKTHITAPKGSLIIHSLAVQPEHRQGGIARSLLEFAIGQLNSSERQSLFIEFARIKWLRQFGVSLGFKPVHQTFSITEWMVYGCWGSVLMKYMGSDR